MSLNDNLKGLITAVADNDLQKAKAHVKVIIANETADKNKGFCKSIKTKLETPASNLIELPYNLQGTLKMEDVSVSFNEKRYYLAEREQSVFRQIVSAKMTNSQLAELGIRYLNSTLLHGESGTGKTTFGRYTAFKLGLPFAYVNFAQCIDSHLGGTAKNIERIFEYVSKQKCVLMLDEIDAIGSKRGGNNELGEMSRIVIGLMQSLDLIENDTVVIGATNRVDAIDEALMRRFSLKHEVKTLDQEEVYLLTKKFLDDVQIAFDEFNVREYAHAHGKQSEIVGDITKAIVQMIRTEKAYRMF